MIRVKKVTWTPEMLEAAHDTPQLALAAPDAGFVRNILGVTHDMEYNSSPYSGGSPQILYGFQIGANKYVFEDSQVLIAETDYNLPARKPVCEDYATSQVHPQSVFSTTKDFYMTTADDVADGDSDIVAYICYEDRELEEDES